MSTKDQIQEFINDHLAFTVNHGILRVGTTKTFKLGGVDPMLASVPTEERAEMVRLAIEECNLRWWSACHVGVQGHLEPTGTAVHIELSA